MLTLTERDCNRVVMSANYNIAEEQENKSNDDEQNQKAVRPKGRRRARGRSVAN